MSRLVVLVLVATLVLTFTAPSDARRHRDKSDSGHEYTTDVNGIALFGPGQSVRDMFLQHVQCRRCVTPLNTTGFSGKELKHMKKHYTTEPMTWCATNLVTDFHGSCLTTASVTPTPTGSGSAACNGVLVSAAEQCANDDPATKPSCTTCVLDGYKWTPNVAARLHKDEYDGACSAVTAESPAAATDMTHLRQCVNLVYNIRGMKAAAHQVSWFVGIVGIIAVVASLCCCLRCCAQIRAARLAKLNAANAAPSSVHYHMLPTPPPPPQMSHSPLFQIQSPPPSAHSVYPAQAAPQPQAQAAQQFYVPPQHTAQPQLARPLAPSVYPVMGARQYGYNIQ